MTPAPPSPVLQVQHVAAYASDHLVAGVVVIVGGMLVLTLGVHMLTNRRVNMAMFTALLSPTVLFELAKWHRHVPTIFRDKAVVPVPIGGRRTPAGVDLVVRFTKGLDAAGFAKMAPDVASVLRCRVGGVVVRPIAHNAGRATVQIARRDPFAKVRRWPLLEGPVPPFLDGTPLGVRLDGVTVLLKLWSRNILVGGIQGAGKTVAMMIIVAHALLSGDVDVHVLDGKTGIGFAAWRGVLRSFATEADSHEKIFAVVARLTAELKRRNAWLTQYDLDKIPQDDPQWPTHLLVIDEYTEFMKIPGFERALTDLVRQGRAAKIIVALGTQRPSAKAVSTDLRAIIAYGLAFTCTESASSNMILRDGCAGAGYDASKFEGDKPGEAYLLAEEAKHPVHLRCFDFTPADRRAVLARVLANRSSATGSAPEDVRSGPVSPGAARTRPVSDDISDPIMPERRNPPHPPKPPLRTYDGSRNGRGVVLAAVVDHGPQISTPGLVETTGLTAQWTAACCKDLLAAGYVTRARQIGPGGIRAGGRDPWVWTATDRGLEALADDEIVEQHEPEGR